MGAATGGASTSVGSSDSQTTDRGDPEIDRAGVLEVGSEVICVPWFVAGPSEVKVVAEMSGGSGQVDIQTMSRQVKWPRGERAARDRGVRKLRFVGPNTDDVCRPITTGLAVSRLLKEVWIQFVVCFCSSHEAYSGDISNVPTATARKPRPEPIPEYKVSTSVSQPSPTSIGSGRRGGRRSKKGSITSTPSPS